MYSPMRLQNRNMMQNTNTNTDVNNENNNRNVINANTDNNIDIREETLQNATYITRAELYNIFYDIQE